MDLRMAWLVLEVQDMPTKADIERAFRRKSKRYHPDLLQSKATEETDRQWNRLKDARERAILACGSDTEQEARSSVQKSFEELQKEKEEFNSIVYVPLDWKTLHAGGAVRVKLRYAGKCPACHGSQLRNEFVKIPDCIECKGKRTVTATRGKQMVCTLCNGRGTAITADNRCEICMGSGKTEKILKVNVDIPPHCKDNQTLATVRFYGNHVLFVSQLIKGTRRATKRKTFDEEAPVVELPPNIEEGEE